MAAIFKSSLQNLSPLLTSLKVEPLAKPKTSLKFFLNTTKPKTKVVAGFGQKLWGYVLVGDIAFSSGTRLECCIVGSSASVAFTI